MDNKDKGIKNELSAKEIAEEIFLFIGNFLLLGLGAIASMISAIAEIPVFIFLVIAEQVTGKKLGKAAWFVSRRLANSAESHGKAAFGY